MFFSETYNYRVRKLAPNGLLTTVAGTGQSGNQGDRGSSTQAGLGLPTGLALDAAGNLYVADTGNFWVRKISPDGVITRYAGTYFGFRGDGMPAEVASLSSPFGLAVGSDGAIYVADSGNNRIRKIASAKIQM